MERGVSDFPLAKGFAEQVRRRGDLAGRAGLSVASPEIVAAFQIKGAENVGWWDRRLRNPGRYGLKIARAALGAAKLPSRWYPEVVAAWLIEEGHMERDDVVRAMKRSFPEIDTDLLH
ncbi:MAG: hypothetical protein IPQ15_09600 [Betaproteobacteria bacterium]|nr:hypothetical protein [Betaproteobacteria bacterium]